MTTAESHSLGSGRHSRKYRGLHLLFSCVPCGFCFRRGTCGAPGTYPLQNTSSRHPNGPKHIPRFGRAASVDAADNELSRGNSMDAVLNEPFAIAIIALILLWLAAQFGGYVATYGAHSNPICAQISASS